MGMDSRIEMERSTLSLEARQKFDELVAVLAAEKYGPDGPPRRHNVCRDRTVRPSSWSHAGARRR
jgi:hypothetical protein